MAREFVPGSLNGCEDPVAEEQSNLIDNVLGYEMEQMVQDSKIDNFIGSADGDMMMVSASNMMTDESSPLAPPQFLPQLLSPPLGYMPQRVGIVEPLAQINV